MEQHAEIGNVTVTYHNEEDFDIKNHREEFENLGEYLAEIYREKIIGAFQQSLIEDENLDPSAVAEFIQKWILAVVSDSDKNSMFTSKSLGKYTDQVICEMFSKGNSFTEDSFTKQ